MLIPLQNQSGNLHLKAALEIPHHPKEGLGVHQQNANTIRGHPHRQGRHLGHPQLLIRQHSHAQTVHHVRVLTHQLFRRHRLHFSMRGRRLCQQGILPNKRTPRSRFGVVLLHGADCPLGLLSPSDQINCRRSHETKRLQRRNGRNSAPGKRTCRHAGSRGPHHLNQNTHHESDPALAMGLIVRSGRCCMRRG